MQELLKHLEILTQMMREYAERHNINCKFLKVVIYADRFSIVYEDKTRIFSSLSFPELIDKLKK